MLATEKVLTRSLHNMSKYSSHTEEIKWRDITPAALEKTVRYQGSWKYLEAPEKTPHGFFLLSRASIYVCVFVYFRKLTY